jgi:hypothetical protein
MALTEQQRKIALINELASKRVAYSGLPRDKQGENRATIRMRTRGWCLVGRA